MDKNIFPWQRCNEKTICHFTNIFLHINFLLLSRRRRTAWCYYDGGLYNATGWAWPTQTACSSRSPLLWIWAYRRANIKIYPQVFGWTTNASWEIYPWHYYLFEYSSFDILVSILYKLGYVKFENDINLCPSFPTKFTSWEVRNSKMSLLYYSF